MTYYLEYAKRFFDPEDLDFRQDTPTTGLMMVKSIPCKHLDLDRMACKAHGTDLQPEDCRMYPFHWNPQVFDGVRAPTCGFYVTDE